jgi:CHU_C Type IX secretion signal domain
MECPANIIRFVFKLFGYGHFMFQNFKMSFKIKYINSVLFFAILLLIFGFNNQTIGQNQLGLKIDTLRAYYTSGKAPEQVKGSIDLLFRLPANQLVTVLMKTNPSGTYTSIGNYGSSTINSVQQIKVTIPNLNVRDVFYCFKIEGKDNLGQVSTSLELCSIPYNKEVNNSADNKVVLQVGSYQPAGPQSGFQPVITSDCFEALGCVADEDRFTTNTISVFPYKARKELGAKIRCGEIKIFQVTIGIEGMVSISDTIHNFGYTTNTPGKIIDKWAYATVENEKVKLRWINDAVKNNDYAAEKKFIISRKDDNASAYTTLNTTATQFIHPGNNKFEWEFIDNTSTPETKKHAYQLKFEDFCGNSSFPIDLYPIFLKQNPKFELEWSAENDNKVTGYELEYFNEKDDPSPRKVVPLDLPENRYLTPDAANYYRIKAKQKEGDVSTIYSNFSINDAEIVVTNPTIFTPDGKGPEESETFKVHCSAYNTFSIIIYDRNGMMVYNSDSYTAHRREGWNGKLPFSNIDASEGVYVFQVDVTNKVLRKLAKRGVFVLVRDK